MTPQQAGVSADLLAKLVAARSKLQKDDIRGSAYKSNQFWADLFSLLDAVDALATAPPEQAAQRIEQLEVQLAGCMTAATGWAKDPPKQGDFGWSQAFQDVLDLRNKYDALLRARTGWTDEPANKPQAVSAGALTQEQVARAIADTQGHWDKNNPAYYTVTNIPALAKSLNALLAAHDQKVGDQLAAWMIVNSFATGHGDTVEDLLKELKWQIEELRARPAPAASKPASEGEVNEQNS